MDDGSILEAKYVTMYYVLGSSCLRASRAKLATRCPPSLLPLVYAKKAGREIVIGECYGLVEVCTKMGDA